MTIDNHFIQQYDYIVLTIVRQYYYLHLEADLAQEGRMGLIQAGRKFNPDCGVLFESYAAWWVRKYIKRAIRQYGHTLSNPDANPDNFAYESDMESVLQREQVIEQTLNLLNARQREVIVLYYGIGCAPHTVEEIAEQLHLSVDNVYKIHLRSIQKCKKKLKKC